MDVLNETVDPRLAHAATLPSRVYFEAGVLASEGERIFGATWQLVGRADQVERAGQFFTATIADEPILVTRGNDGRLRALTNVCRHRAGPVASGAGCGAAFRCGYHGWSYALDGRLLGTPDFDGVEGFKKEEHGLPEFQVDVWLGLVFVNLNPAAPPLRSTLGEMGASLESRGLSAMRFADRRHWTIDCNWKVYVDNYLEGYHIPIVHPGLMKTLDFAKYRTETFGDYSRQHAPLRGTSDDAEYYWIFPNLMLNVFPDNFSTNLILPLGAGRTVTVFEWFYDRPERPEAREAMARIVEVSEEIQREDIAICEAVQKGLASRTYDRGRFSVKRENGVHHFHRLYAEAVGSAVRAEKPVGASHPEYAYGRRTLVLRR